MARANRLVLAALISAESIALYMLAAFLATTSGGPLPPYVIYPLALVGGYTLTRLLLRFEVNAAAQGAVGAVGSAVGLWLLLSLAYDPRHWPLSFVWLDDITADPEVFLASHWSQAWGLALLVVAWFRGALLAQRNLAAPGVATSFGAGLLLVIILLLAGQGTRARSAIDAAVLPYIVFGLLALALLQLDRAEQQRTSVPRGPWLLTLLGTVGALLLLSLFVGLFPLDALNTLLAPVGRLALRLLDLVIFIIAYPLALFLQWLFGLLMGGREFDMPRLNDPASTAVEELARQSERHILVAVFFTLVRVLFLAALAVGIGYLLWRAFRRLHRPAPPAGELRETIEGEGSLGSDLGDLLRGLGRRLLPRRLVTPEPALPADVLAVRRLYLRALDRADRAGAPRPAAATPSEFAPTLGATLHTPAATTLSEQFAAARYGLRPPAPAELTAVERGVEHGAPGEPTAR